MGISNSRWFCFALFFVSSVAFSAVNVDARSGYYRLNSSSILVPENTVVYPKNKTPSLRSVAEGIYQRVSFDVRSSVPDLPTTNIPTAGDLLVTNEGFKQAFVSKVDVNTACDDRSKSRLLDNWLRDNDDVWYCNLAGVLTRRGSGGSSGGWTPSDVSLVSRAAAQSALSSPDAIERTVLMQTYTVRVPAGRDEENQVIRPPLPEGVPPLVYDSPSALPCSSFDITNALSCIAIGRSDRSYGGTQWQFTTLFAASHFDYGNPAVTYSPRLVGVDSDPYSTSTKSSFTVVNYPEDFEAGDEEEVPVSQADFDEDVEANYVPSLNDWAELFLYLPDTEPALLVADPIPDYQFSPVVKTVVDVDTEESVVEEVTNFLDYDYVANAVARPELSLDFNSSKRSYVDGVLVGGNDSVITYLPGVDVGGDGDLPSTQPDGFGPGNEPYCDWADVVCDFIDWIKDDDGLPDEHDFSQLRLEESSFIRDYVFPSGSLSCPEPIVIHIAFVGVDVEIVYDWWCEIALLINPFVMFSAYLTAIYITLGSSVRRG